MQTIDFDLDRFIRTSDRVDLSEVDWDRASDPPLTPAEIRVLRLDGTHYLTEAAERCVERMGRPFGMEAAIGGRGAEPAFLRACP